MSYCRLESVHMTYSAHSSSRWHTALTWTLRSLLGVAFIYIGTAKLTGMANTVEYFDAIGWGQWFRYVTGFLDVLGVILILVPRLTFYGAVVLVGSVGTGALISFTVLAANPVWGNSAMKLIPLTLTVLAVSLALLTDREVRLPLGA
jgi:putative oxidoreductase